MFLTFGEMGEKIYNTAKKYGLENVKIFKEISLPGVISPDTRCSLILFCAIVKPILFFSFAYMAIRIIKMLNNKA